MHLNSLYIHLRGACDNLAWALHYEFALLGTSDETDFDTRRRCDLFGNPFIERLQAVSPTAAAFLREKKAWYTAFKEFRDPVAHRVPLYAMPGVVRKGSNEEERIRRLNDESSASLAAGDAVGSARKLFEALSVGEYEPWFMQYGANSVAVRDIHYQIYADLAEFFSVSEIVLPALFRAPLTRIF